MLAFHRDSSSHELDKAMTDSQAEAGSTVLLCDGSIGLRKLLEELFLLSGRHTDSRVSDFKCQPVAMIDRLSLYLQGDRAVIGEFARSGEVS